MGQFWKRIGEGSHILNIKYGTEVYEDEELKARKERETGYKHS